MSFIRSPIICILGHVDHGKCVASETRITLSDGTIITARELFESYSQKGNELKLEDGVCIELEESPNFLSFDGRKIVSVPVSHIWKKQAKQLIKVTLANGDKISTTQEHPFLVFNEFKTEFRRADQLKKSDVILGPSSFDLKQDQNWKAKILEKMAEANQFVVFLDPERSKKLTEKIYKTTITRLQEKGLLTTHYHKSRYRTSDLVKLAHYFKLDLNQIYDWIIAFKNASNKFRAGKTSIAMRMPNESQLYELGYILGAFAGDGSLEGVTLHNNDHEVRDTYIENLKSIFGAESKVQFGHTAWQVKTNGSKTLSRFFSEVLGVCCKKEKCATITVPWICHGSFDAYKGFIEGWFDTDGYVSEINNCVEFTSKSENIVREAAILLSGLGIHSTIYQKKIYWTLKIANDPFVSRFFDIFKPKLTRRTNSLTKILNKSSTSRVYEKYSISIDFKNRIKKAMPGKINRTIGFFNRSINYPTLSGNFLKQIVRSVSKPNSATEEMGSFLNNQLIGVCIRDIEVVDNPHEWVYDFTIPQFHNFVAERVIVHNTTLLDSVRGTTVAKKEAGGITQMIGASYVSKEDIESISKGLAEKMKLEMRIPGLLFIDTPGHEAFSNLRDRGGSIADLAVLVIDANIGFQPQTIESIKILKQYKTPFIIAANKVDSISGWKKNETYSFFESFNLQPEHVRQRVDDKLYGLMGTLSEHGFDSERFDRVKDFSKQIGIVPISAKTKEGLSELLVIIAGLSQKFLEGSLEIDENGRGKGSVMEVKEEKGLGTVVDVIIYDGILKKNDEIAFLTIDGVKKTRIRGLLLPNLSGKEKYTYIDSAVAAAGIRIYAPGLEGAIPGSPLEATTNFEEDKKTIEAQFKSIIFQKDEQGVIVRADSLGSVEALVRLLTNEGIKVRDASVGNITRKEVLAASAVGANDKFLGVVLGFNVKVLDEASVEGKNSNVPIIISDVIYRLIDEYKNWIKDEKERMKKESISKLTWPGKIKVLNGYVFRVSKPAVFGINVLSGRIKRQYRLMNKAGEIVGEVREIQKEKEKVDEAVAGDELAISCEGITIGKNVSEGDVLYMYMTEDELKKWESQLHLLSNEDKAVFEETRRMLRIMFENI